MRKFLLSTAVFAATLVSTAASAQQVEHRFTRNGATYAYTMVQKGDRIVLAGTCETTGTPFELTVQGDRVTGRADGMPVSFRVAHAQTKLAEAVTELASR